MSLICTKSSSSYNGLPRSVEVETSFAGALAAPTGFQSRESPPRCSQQNRTAAARVDCASRLAAVHGSRCLAAACAQTNAEMGGKCFASQQSPKVDSSARA